MDAEETPKDKPEASVKAAYCAASVLVPFQMPNGMAREVWVERILARRIPGRSTGEPPQPVWVEQTNRPVEMRELTSSFATSLNAPPGDEPKDHGTIWLRWSDSLRGRCSDVAIAGRKADLARVALRCIDMFLVTQDAGVLSLEMELPPGLALGEVSLVLNAVRHMQGEARTPGLRFPREAAREAIDSEYLGAWGPIVGPAFGDLASAFGREAPGVVPLGAFANWLLLLPGEDPGAVDITAPPKVSDTAAAQAAPHAAEGSSNPPPEAPGPGAKVLPECAKVGWSRYAKHHSVVVLESPPEPGEIRTWLFHLSHAFAEEYLPPQEASWQVRILEPRGNRLVGVSRTGACSISWVPAGVNDTFERAQWPSKFMGIYRLLGIHVLNEHQSLLLRATELASFGPRIRRLTATPTAHSLRKDLDVLREELDVLVNTTIGQMLTLTTAGDCSASLPDYAEFYSAERHAHGLDPLIAGIREDLRDVVDVVSSLNEREERAAEKNVSRAVFLLAAVLAPFSAAQGMGALFPGHFPDSVPGLPGWVWLAGLLAVTTVAMLWLRRGRRRRGP